MARYSKKETGYNFCDTRLPYHNCELTKVVAETVEKPKKGILQTFKCLILLCENFGKMQNLDFFDSLSMYLNRRWTDIRKWISHKRPPSANENYNKSVYTTISALAGSQY